MRGTLYHRRRALGRREVEPRQRVPGARPAHLPVDLVHFARAAAGRAPRRALPLRQRRRVPGAWSPPATSSSTRWCTATGRARRGSRWSRSWPPGKRRAAGDRLAGRAPGARAGARRGQRVHPAAVARGAGAAHARARPGQRGRDRASRLAAAREEMSHYDEFDYVIVNEVFDRAVDEMCAIFIASRLRRDRQVAAPRGADRHAAGLSERDANPLIRQGRSLPRRGGQPLQSAPPRTQIDGRPAAGSPMARITVEDCLEVVDNRFELVMMAAKRARQLANGVEPQLDNSETRQADRARAARDRRRAASTRPTSTRSTRPSASARSARRWSGPPPKWSPTTTCPRAATTDGSQRSSRQVRTAPPWRGRFAFARPGAPPSHALPPCAWRLTRRRRAMPQPTPRRAGRRRGAGLRARARSARPITCPTSSAACCAAPRRSARAAHAGQTRKIGEPYITHPVAVAGVLAEQRHGRRNADRGDPARHARRHAADAREQIAAEFGETVAELVDGVTKLDKLQLPRPPGSRRRKLPQDAAGDGARPARDPDQARRPPAQHAHARRADARGAPAHRARDARDLRADRAAAGHEPDSSPSCRTSASARCIRGATA